jgi:two-component system nitrate/nitrite response regulator NarL
VNLVICDDHRLLAECLAGLLAARGHRVVASVSHPDDAVRVIAGATGGYIDVCVMDLTFSDTTGFGAIRAIRASSPSTKVVALSGSGQPFAEARAFDAGAAAFVSKDDDVSRVIDSIERRDRHDGPFACVASREVDDAHHPPEPFDGVRLTAREREVLRRLVTGERTQTIAAGMGVSYSTARTHVQNLLHKLGVHSRLEAVAFALRHSLVPVGRRAG